MLNPAILLLPAGLVGVRPLDPGLDVDHSGLGADDGGLRDLDRGLALRPPGHRLLDRPDPPTAVLAFSDLLALGVMDAAAERGVDVPGRLSVVGFDDIAEAAPAGLTTVRQPHDEKGAAAVRLLLDSDDRGSVVLPAELIVRSTTAPPRPQERSPCS